MDQDRIEKEKKFNIRWKHRWKRIVGNISIVIGICLTIGVVTGVTWNYVHLNKPVIKLPESTNVKYVDTYEELDQKDFIKPKDMFNIPMYQYLVFFIANDCPHCHEEKFEKFVANYASEYPKSGPMKIFFINSKSYGNPHDLFTDEQLAKNEKEARDIIGISKYEDFKFYGFPSMYLIQGEGENSAENINSVKHIKGIFIGNNEIKNVLVINRK